MSYLRRTLTFMRGVLNMNYEEMIKKLREPFSSKEIDWKIQVTTQDKSKGMAVVYMDARAVQKRLDEVVGAFNWKNVYSLWHDNSQICGISIFNAERNEWVTKFDGAENSDIEPIKGGLSDSFKRAAAVWGIGRYMYEIDGIWVEIEARGKSFVIKQNQYSRLENEYNAAISKLFASDSKQKNASAIQPTQISVIDNAKIAYDYEVHSIRLSGKSSQVLELVDNNGDMIKAYIRAADKSIKTGVRLCNVHIEKKKNNYGEYNLISAYQIAA